MSLVPHILFQKVISLKLIQSYPCKKLSVARLPRIDTQKSCCPLKAIFFKGKTLYYFLPRRLINHNFMICMTSIPNLKWNFLSRVIDFNSMLEISNVIVAAEIKLSPLVSNPLNAIAHRIRHRLLHLPSSLKKVPLSKKNTPNRHYSLCLLAFS